MADMIVSISLVHPGRLHQMAPLRRLGEPMIRTRLARRLRFLADRIDHAGAPKHMSSLSVALEQGRGWVLRQDGTGVPIWYFGDADYVRAWEPPARISTTN